MSPVSDPDRRLSPLFVIKRVPIFQFRVPCDRGYLRTRIAACTLTRAFTLACAGYREIAELIDGTHVTLQAFPVNITTFAYSVSKEGFQ